MVSRKESCFDKLFRRRKKPVPQTPPMDSLRQSLREMSVGVTRPPYTKTIV